MGREIVTRGARLIGIKEEKLGIHPLLILRPFSSPYSSKKYPAGFLRTLAILAKVFIDGNDAPVL